MVSTQDSESCDPSSNLGGTLVWVISTYLQSRIYGKSLGPSLCWLPLIKDVVISAMSSLLRERAGCNMTSFFFCKLIRFLTNYGYFTLTGFETSPITAETGFHGVMVSTQDSESCDPSSNLGGTWFFSHYHVLVGWSDSVLWSLRCWNFVPMVIRQSWPSG